MARRIHVGRLTVGEIAIDTAQAHHARDVLRLPHGTIVEVFDDAGATADGVLLTDGGDAALVRVEVIRAPAAAARRRLVVASAVPKGDRADWMVEKLSELGAAEWVPLAAARSVVLPEGKGKHDRWVRIATEAAKQSRRAGVMTIAPLTPVNRLLETSPAGGGGVAWCLSTERPGRTVFDAIEGGLAAAGGDVLAFVGPEGGWTPAELDRFAAAGVAFVRLTETILRIETAAVAVAAVVAAAAAATLEPPTDDTPADAARS